MDTYYVLRVYGFNLYHLISLIFMLVCLGMYRRIVSRGELDLENETCFTHVLLGTSKMLVGGCVELLIVYILTPIHHSLCKVCTVCRLIQCMFCDYRTESGST